MATRVDDARSLLEAERDDLAARLQTVEAALATLGNGQSPTSSRTRPQSSKQETVRPKRTNRRRTKWSKEELTCPDPDCDFVANAPQGLAGHVRTKHPDLQAPAKAES